MRHRQLLIIFLTVFVDLVGFGIIIPLNPYLAREFGADALDIGLLMAIYSAMQFLFSPIWGQLSDRFGRRPIILMSLLGAGFSHLLFAFAETYLMLFVARMLAGIFGANISTAMAYIADITPEKERSKGMGLIGAAFGLGFVLGPFIGGVFGHIGQSLGSVPPFGYSFAAVIAAVICLANFVFALFVLPESLPPHVRGAVQQRPSRLWLLTRYLKQATVGRLMVAFFLSTLAMAHMEASLFLFVQDEFGWDLMKASFGFAYVGLIMVFTQGYLIRKLMPKMGERRVMLIGLTLAALGLTGIGASYQVWLMAITVTLLSLGNGMTHPSLTGSISLLATREDQGAAMGVNQSLAALGRIIGPAAGGWFYRDVGHSSPFLAAGLLTFVALSLAVSVYGKIPQAGKVK